MPLLFAYGKNRFSHDVAHIINMKKNISANTDLINKYLLSFYMVKRNVNQLNPLIWRV